MAVATPPFSSLPLNTSGPIGNAWGLWGIGDQLGMLNRLNESTTVAALQEVQHGIRVCTDWTLDNPLVPPFGRKPFEHGFVTKFFQTGRSSIDDTININSQSSSQWDGFRHFGYQGTAQYFNGVTNEQILNGTDNILGLHHWVNGGGIVGRGVLLDYAEYMAAHGIQYDVFNNTEILASDLDAVLAFQNTTTRPGDILFIRSNLTTRFKELSQEAQNAYSGANPLPGMGVKSEEATLRWIWDREPAAVASDMIAFEITPMVATPFLLHEWLLAGWGMPIGELFDLQKLGDTAKRLNKYTFFFSSVPLNVSNYSRIETQTVGEDTNRVHRYQEAWPVRLTELQYSNLVDNTWLYIAFPKFCQLATLYERVATICR